MKDSMTLHLTGSVSLAEFALAVNGFQTLIQLLQSSRASSAQVDWIVSDLQPGSAMATVQGVPRGSTLPADIENIVNGYEDVVRAIPKRDFTNIPLPIRDAVFQIAKIAGSGGVKSVVFETEEVDASVDNLVGGLELPFNSALQRSETRAFLGGVRGKIQALNNRGQLRFTLYDSLHDRAVSCYMRKGSEEQIRDKWGKNVSVIGLVKRDEDGQPKVIRDIREIALVDESQHNWRDAFGCAPAVEGSISVEDAIRGGRDDE